MADTTKPTPELPVVADAAQPVLPVVPVVPVEQPKAIEPLEPVTQATTEVTPAPAPGVETSTAPAEESKEEAKNEEVKPVEEGALEVKGTSFPKNLFYSKQFFWFGNEAVETKSLSTYLRTEKVTGTAHNVAAWASETGKGLLFFGEKQSDKSVPHGAIELSEASEPTVDGPQKFNLTSKGHKHSFKAANTAERDNWVAQLKLKISEAKELAPSVKESENYKKTIDGFKPKPVAAPKEEQKVDAPAATEATKPEESAAVVAPTEEVAKTDEVAKKDEKERRSASRKRGSIFGNLLNKPKEEKAKHDEKKDEKKEEKLEAEAAPTEAIVPATSEAPVAVETSDVPVELAPALVDTTPAVETSTPNNKTDTAKPVPTKRSSIFGVFGKKEKKTADAETSPAVPAKDATTPLEVSESAPVIPAVETSAPLTTEVVDAAPVTTAETTTSEVPAVSNAESKKEVKNDKRKSSLPFNFGGKSSKATSDSEGEGRSKSPSAFSRLRSTIKGKPKPVDKTEEKSVDADASKDVARESEPVKTEEAKPAVVDDVTATKPVAVTPQVAASA